MDRLGSGDLTSFRVTLGDPPPGGGPLPSLLPPMIPTSVASMATTSATTTLYHQPTPSPADSGVMSPMTPLSGYTTCGPNCTPEQQHEEAVRSPEDQDRGPAAARHSFYLPYLVSSSSPCYNPDSPGAANLGCGVGGRQPAMVAAAPQDGGGCLETSNYLIPSSALAYWGGRQQPDLDEGRGHGRLSSDDVR